MPQEPSDFEKLAGILGVSTNDAESLYWKYRVPYDKGDWDATSYWRQIAIDLGLGLGLGNGFAQEQIEEAIDVDVSSWMRCNSQIVGWAQRLREQGLKTAILSNMPHDLRKRVNASDSWLPAFDHHTYSCLLNVMKPQFEIYEHCVNGLGVPIDATLFIDDRKENIAAAISYGMNAILFETNEALAAALARDYSYLPSVDLTRAG